MVAAPDGLHLIEIKNWKGHLSNEGATGPGGAHQKNPLDLAVQKGKELHDYLNLEAQRLDIPSGALHRRLDLHGSTLDAKQPRQLPGQHVYAPDQA